jgi:hypothetical protein
MMRPTEWISNVTIYCVPGDEDESMLRALERYGDEHNHEVALVFSVRVSRRRPATFLQPAEGGIQEIEEVAVGPADHSKQPEPILDIDAHEWFVARYRDDVYQQVDLDDTYDDGWEHYYERD